MTPVARRGLAVLAAGALVAVGFQIADRVAAVTELDAAQLESQQWDARLGLVLGEHDEVSQRMGELRVTSETYDLLIDARSGFVTSLDAVSAAFASADGKVDVASQRTGILALQQKVLAERADVSVVTDAAGTAKGVASEVTTAVADYDREQARIAAEQAAAAASAPRGLRAWSGGGSGGGAAGSGGGGYDRVRAALDRVGGGGVPLQEFAGACGGGSAAACASSSGVILFTPGLASWSDGRLHWAMAHELSHIHQFRVWGSLMASGSYASLFGGNIELLANCMAAQRGYGSGNVSCSAAQLGFAGAIWGGGVPG